ncbi:MAG: hypothetical protein DRQ39_07125 [Gammaproteobacteria bacterium]|nr:MAG: hypothetical protein DRQ39_07125 [Gammaproteobacteria bacterium]
MKTKFKLEGILTVRKDLSSLQKKEIASRLNLPQNDKNERDLMFMSAILVSTGTNKNGAHFLGSELIKARQTISQKPLNIEHQEQAIIGHITEWLFMDQEGAILDDEALFNSVSLPSEKAKSNEDLKADLEQIQKNVASIDKIDMDIGIVCAVYRDRFSEIAEDIEMGLFKVSMECYFDNFDLKVGEFILPRGVAQSASVEELRDRSIDLSLVNQMRAVASGKSLGNILVSRVLRGIHFCGVGIVENPANVRSLILEAAKQVDRKVAALDVLDGQLAVASVDLADVKLTENTVCLEVAESKTTITQFAVIKDGQIIHTATDWEQAKSVATELVFKTFHLGSQVLELNQSTGEFYKWGSPEDSLTDSGITIVELISRFSPVTEVETSCCTYSVEDGIVTASSEVMESTKVCGLKDNRHCEGTEVEPDQPKGESSNLEEVVKEEVKEEVKEADIEANIEAPTIAEVKEEQMSPAPSEAVQPINIPKPPVTTSKQERVSLKSEQFGLRNQRKFPIHTVDRVEANLDFFKFTRKKLTRENQEEFYINLIKSAAKLGVSTVEFEKKCDLRFLNKKEFSENFGVPRLKKFPLDNKQQVISAMSRFSRLSMDLSSMEKENLFVNILRAAAKLGIDTNAFRQRVKTQL